jgi:hypothetical protein
MGGMNRLTGDFKGASMFATVEQARIYNKLRQYEDTGLSPADCQAHADADIPYLLDENARLRAELEAAKVPEGVERAVQGVKEATAYGGRMEMFEAASDFWKAWDEWRGLCAENGGKDG